MLPLGRDVARGQERTSSARSFDDVRLPATTGWRETTNAVRTLFQFVIHQTIRFILLCEGTSDRPLVAHLRRLLSSCGALEVVGSAIALSSIHDPGNHRGSALARKLRAALAAESEFELIFIHRDANSAGYEARFEEIREATETIDRQINWIPLIPSRATEAWLLLDERAIRLVAGNPRGSQPLDLPRPSRVEEVSNPKATLRDALAAASGYTDSRLRRFKQRFGSQRRVLLEQLPTEGSLTHVPSWIRLKQHATDFVSGFESRRR